MKTCYVFSTKLQQDVLTWKEKATRLDYHACTHTHNKHARFAFVSLVLLFLS